MVKTVYIAELNDGDDLLNEPFLLQDLVRRETKDGRPYLLCTYRDKTSHINSVFWDVPADVDDWIRPGIVVLVTGRVSNYRNALQITTTDLNPIEADNLSQFLPSSERRQDEMIKELRQTIDELSDPWKELVGRILLDPDFLIVFANAPAARLLHHAYIGGLLEHSLSMATLARFLAQQYPYVNIDLLISGTLLHDVGKALEYDTGSSFDFTDDGRLVGHVMRAAIMVEHAAEKMGNVAEEDLRQLIHLISSHHGTMEWGAPVVPKTLEAILLHQIDLLDSRIQGFYDHLRNDNSGGAWTSKQSYMFETELRRPPGFK
jgi:3'-5' exoribonuclease